MELFNYYIPEIIIKRKTNNLKYSVSCFRKMPFKRVQIIGNYIVAYISRVTKCLNIFR